MRDGFETFNDQDDGWLTELEISDRDFDDEAIDWDEARAREFADTGYGRDEAPRGASEGPREFLRVPPRPARPGPGSPGRAARPRQAGPRRPAGPRGRFAAEGRRQALDPDEPELDDDLTTFIRTGSRPSWPEPGRRGPSAQERTQALIDRGRRSTRRGRKPRSRKMLLGGVVLAAVVTIASVIIFRPKPSWPPSVATVQSEITTACQNPNVVSEPGQVNFACGKDTSQILWVFSLMTSGDNPQFTDAKTGRQGLEPIAPTQGGEVAWSLNLHHPYNPYDPVDSLEVAARAINNIIGGATLTTTNGKPAVQPGLESDPGNCAKYTGSSAVVSHAGFPSLCAQPVSSTTGQAALVADAYRQWMVGATAAAAYDVSVLFANASNPGSPQVQAILKTLPNVK